MTSIKTKRTCSKEPFCSLTLSGPFSQIWLDSFGSSGCIQLLPSNTTSQTIRTRKATQPPCGQLQADWVPLQHALGTSQASNHTTERISGFQNWRVSIPTSYRSRTYVTETVTWFLTRKIHHTRGIPKGTWPSFVFVQSMHPSGTNADHPSNQHTWKEAGRNACVCVINGVRSTLLVSPQISTIQQGWKSHGYH